MKVAGLGSPRDYGASAHMAKMMERLWFRGGLSLHLPSGGVQAPRSCPRMEKLRLFSQAIKDAAREGGILSDKI